MPEQRNLFGETIPPEIWEESCPLVEEGKVTIVHVPKLGKNSIKIIEKIAQPFSIPLLDGSHGFYCQQKIKGWFPEPIQARHVTAYVEWNNNYKGICVMLSDDSLADLIRECRQHKANLFMYNPLEECFLKVSL